MKSIRTIRLLRSGVCLLTLSILLNVVLLSQEDNTKLQSTWVESLNADKIERSILDHYLSGAGTDYGDGFTQSQIDLYSSLINLKSEAGLIDDPQIVATNRDGRGNLFELGFLHSRDKSSKFCYVTGWRKSNDGMLKEVELLAEVSKFDEPSKAEIDAARQLWVKHSNAHRPDLVVGEVYTPDARYFNNGRVSIGSSQIIERYAYMTMEGWEIQLTPVHTAFVSPTRAFEIGTYTSSGTGQYILIWAKQSNGSWKAEFDFNF